MKNNYKLEIWLPIITFIIGFILSPIQSFFDKNFEDLATKKNISEITQQIEEVKILYNSKLDSLREELGRQSEVISRRREVYSKIAKSMRIFIEGNYNVERKEELLNNYSELWLWAPDYVIEKFNIHIAQQLKISSGEKITQKELKESYSNFIIAMRKDVGFQDTKLRNNNFLYFYF